MTGAAKPRRAAMIEAPTARLLLLAVWFGGFVINLGAIGWIYARGWVDPVNFKQAMHAVNDLYAPYLGAIALYYWGSRGSATLAADSAGRERVGAWLALAVSSVWNVAGAAIVVPLIRGGTIEDALGTMHDVIGIFSWLVAGAIGFYFGSTVDSAKRG